jgi:hypothetical protein
MKKVMHIGQMIGGLDIYIRNTITYSKKELDYVIVHGEADNNPPIIRKGISVKEIRVSMYRTLNPWKDLKCLIQVIRAIRLEKPDIIHCHSAKGGVIGRLAGFITGTKTFYTPHAFSFLSSSSSLKQKIFLLLERTMKLNSYLLACSESEKELGIRLVHYSKDRSFVWNNAVPDASKTL